MKPRPQKNRKTSPTKTTTTPSRRDHLILADFATLRIPVTADKLDAALKHAQDAWLIARLDFLHRLLADQAGLCARERSSPAAQIKDAGLGDPEASASVSLTGILIPPSHAHRSKRLLQADFLGPPRPKPSSLSVKSWTRKKSADSKYRLQAACTIWYKVKYVTSGELLEDLTAALADQTIHDRIRFYARFDLLIIDEFGLDLHRTQPLARKPPAYGTKSSTRAASEVGSTALITNITDFEAWAEDISATRRSASRALLDRVVDGAPRS